MKTVDVSELGLDPSHAGKLIELFHQAGDVSPPELWKKITAALDDRTTTPAVYRQLWEHVFEEREADAPVPTPMWFPPSSVTRKANLTRWMKDAGFKSYEDFHSWSVTERAEFWHAAIQRLNIQFDKPPTRMLDSTVELF